MGTMIAISKLIRDAGTQARAELSKDTVSEYAEAMKNGAKFPPVKVIHDGKKHYLWDGFHTTEAAETNKAKEIEAEIEQGTLRDAILKSLGANAAHGQRRTNEEKRRVVLRMLHDEEWAQWSDREIARRCAVDNAFVGRLRREVCPPPSTVDGQQLNGGKRKGADGKSRKLPGPRAPKEPPTTASTGKPTTRTTREGAQEEHRDEVPDLQVAKTNAPRSSLGDSGYQSILPGSAGEAIAGKPAPKVKRRYIVHAEKLVGEFEAETEAEAEELAVSSGGWPMGNEFQARVEVMT